MQRISDAERLIMEIIWKAGRPMTTLEIIQRLPQEKTWKQNTVVTFLSRLIEKGIIKATKKGKANLYEACVTEQEYLNFETKQFIKDVHKGSIFGFISALCDNGDITREDIEALMKRLKE
ncbi:BlaI/MecI/CopY family transcriptional regulator [Lutispora thermophila]|uniref:Predicted transcriptional regulator n=1 Tax=Lutispora thermophila DSM 19022 TaxID=1122184 RepID=A0A1M6IHU7_9FIRM|nr:BlaI/MecI/CopY family transcriptional regulator [Lutispora thermophila]SHJ34041.1 Predicted transcriptional regulator [Lutispora thermophila DSM 19022]